MIYEPIRGFYGKLLQDKDKSASPRRHGSIQHLKLAQICSSDSIVPTEALPSLVIVFPLWNVLDRSQLPPTAVCWWHCWSTGNLCFQPGRGAAAEEAH